jgi:uncharacterized delta-60 repeat protein
VVVGNSQSGDFYFFHAAQFNPDGTIDSTFGKKGIATFALGSAKRASASSMVIQPDGKIVVVGTVYRSEMIDGQIVLIRWNPDGSRDHKFGSFRTFYDGYQKNTASGMAVDILSNGKIVVVGNCHGSFLTMIFKADGKPDGKFGVDGVLIHDLTNWLDGAEAVSVQPDDKIIVAGTAANPTSHNDFEFALVRYFPDGRIDSTFGAYGVVRYVNEQPRMESLKAVLLQPDGKIIANGPFIARRYLPDGTLDPGFGTDGTLLTQTSNWDPSGHSVAIQPDGKILITGNSVLTINGGQTNRMVLKRYYSDGSPDINFGDKGVWAPSFFDFDNYVGSAVAILPEGKVLIAGAAVDGRERKSDTVNFFVARLVMH